MPGAPVTRRRLLLSSALVCGLAGCSGTPDTSDSESTDGSTSRPTDGASSSDESAESSVVSRPADSPTDTTQTPSPTQNPDSASSPADEAESPSPDEDLDLREANVVGVAFSRSGGSYRFEVTLYHDDDGEDGYADWWQVETLDGEQLGRRTLLHAHSTAPFTRSETISIPEEVRYVVVRGHDQTHGYGGQAMVVDIETGETDAVRQGSEPQDFSDYEPSG